MAIDYKLPSATYDDQYVRNVMASLSEKVSFRLVKMLDYTEAGTENTSISVTFDKPASGILSFITIPAVSQTAGLRVRANGLSYRYWGTGSSTANAVYAAIYADPN